MSLVATVVVMALPSTCVVAPLLLEIEVGAAGPIAAVAIAAVEAAAAAVYACGPALRRLATVEP